MEACATDNKLPKHELLESGSCYAHMHMWLLQAGRQAGRQTDRLTRRLKS
jgi:hypothetical protein